MEVCYVKKIITLNTVTIFVSLLFCITASANPVWDEPYVIQQPNGEIIDCFMSGDEYFNYIHDADGYLIKKDEETVKGAHFGCSSFLLAIIFCLYYNKTDI